MTTLPFPTRTQPPAFDAARLLQGYRHFLEQKCEFSRDYGFAIPEGLTHPMLKPHQADIVRWCVKGGRRAVFARFGLGKTMMQLETARLILEQDASHPEPHALIVAPLGVRQEFLADAAKLGITVRFIRSTEELAGPGIYLTNYESVREGKIDAARFLAVFLDEAAILRGFGGTKTFREFMRRFDTTPYRFVATATPAPNEYIEILSYAAFLGVMDVGEAKTRFFKRNSEKADQLTLHPHKEEEFWEWVNTWAVFVQRPSDLGYSDEGYDLPALTINWHMVDETAGDAAGAALPITGAPIEAETDWKGQHTILDASAGGASLGVVGAARRKRSSLPARVAKVAELVAARPDDHVVIWHDLEDERKALESALADVAGETAKGVFSVYGAQDLDEREGLIAAFAAGTIPRLAAKPVMLGSGCNLQHHCAWAIFAGVGFKFNEFIQALHRVYRFLQTREVTIDIVYSAREASVRKELEAKWARYDAMMAKMAEIIREHGLHSLSGVERLTRSINVERDVARGQSYELVHDDTVYETARRAADAPDSVGLILTSIPFGTQYEYTPSYNDFGHTDDDAHFWRQMDYLSPSLYRVLKPGRVMAVHVKDRIRPGGMDGLGFQTVSPFHADAIQHYRRHGFAYVGMITVVTDVVRENAQTYRLGWTEQCKDGSKMGVGMPEYVLLFRKPPTDRSKGYADERVVKRKADYSVARWQVDAHGYWRSSGNTLLSGPEFVRLPAAQIFRRFRQHSLAETYDYAAHVATAERLLQAKRLPPGFMLLQPQSTHPDVWTDVTRMRTLNGAQALRNVQQHLCPLQFDIVDRLIARYSNPGDVVYDPFAGLGTVPMCAVQAGRFGAGAELNPQYFADSDRYCQAAEAKRRMPTLFDLLTAGESASEGAGAPDERTDRGGAEPDGILALDAGAEADPLDDPLSDEEFDAIDGAEYDEADLDVGEDGEAHGAGEEVA